MNIRHPLSVLLVFSFLFSFTNLIARAEDKLEHTKDSLETVKRNLADRNAVILDVREKTEWDAGHLAQAALAPLSKLQTSDEAKALVKDLDAKKIIYCHCKSGRRVLSAAEILKKLGYDARPLKQGYDELVAEGFPKAK
jgi:rhodanese-related sulfurtransferase